LSSAISLFSGLPGGRGVAAEAPLGYLGQPDGASGTWCRGEPGTVAPGERFGAQAAGEDVMIARSAAVTVSPLVGCYLDGAPPGKQRDRRTEGCPSPRACPTPRQPLQRGHWVLFTFAGAGIVVVVLLGRLLQKRTAKSAQPATAS
jgi:hypothetical protein